VGLVEIEVMAGTRDARDFLEFFEYESALVGLLEGLECLSYIPEPFWTFLEGKRFTGALQGLEEGTRLPNRVPYATLGGRIGEVVL
jgi:nicotinic acid phosphoribosyltransferase